jgi:hypothetical protein
MAGDENNGKKKFSGRDFIVGSGTAFRLPAVSRADVYKKLPDRRMPYQRRKRQREDDRCRKIHWLQHLPECLSEYSASPPFIRVI